MIRYEPVFYTFDDNGAYWVIDEVVKRGEESSYVVSVVFGSDMHIRYDIDSFYKAKRLIAENIGIGFDCLVNLRALHCHINGYGFIETCDKRLESNNVGNGILHIHE